MESVRVDQWLWAVRLYKTRVAATDACKAHHVHINGLLVKPASQVKVGDRVNVWVGDRNRVLEVTKVLDKRVGAPQAAECMNDHSPPKPESPAVLSREHGSGRPTKRDRRDLDRMRW